MTLEPAVGVVNLVKLLALPGMGPARLRWLTSVSDPRVVVEHLQKRRLPPVGFDPARPINDRTKEQWFDSIRGVSDQQVVERLMVSDVEVLTPQDEAWPFVYDPEPPSILFVRGNRSLLRRRPSVAIVGTRRCTSLGRRVATAMAETLAAADVAVVSGLALGIDGAAHAGALRARPDGQAPVVGVVATGLDIVYPARHGDLWAEVGARGVLVSEAPPGVAPARWRFPARNRIIAALADLVVVVESHEEGGALSTVDEAIERSTPVLAVPGSVLSPASAGSNRLLLDGAVPVRHGDDVLELLGLSAAAVGTGEPVDPESTPKVFQDPHVVAVLSELSAGSQTIDELARTTEQPVDQLLSLVQQLSLDDVVVIEGSRVRLS